MKTQLLAGAVAAAFALGGLVQAAPMNGNMNSNNSSNVSSQANTAGNAKVNTQAPNQSPFDYSLINLSSQQQKALYQAASSFKTQNVPQKTPGHPVIAGAKLPSSISLKPIPQNVKQKFNGVNAKKVKNFKLAKVQNGDVLVVNPKDRMVEAVITQKEANGQTSSTVGQGSQQNNSIQPNSNANGNSNNGMNEMQK